MPVFVFIARQGRMVLIAGLLVGVFMPEFALLLRPAIAPMIVMLLFLAVLRLGPPGIAAGVSALRRAAAIALLLQLVLPLGAVALFVAFGVLAHPLATGAVLALAAAPITGSPNITLMVGGDPAAALRQLVVGTALLPLTALPVFFAMPTFGSPLAVALASIKLLALITVTGGVALLLRRSGIVPATDRSFAIMDGVAALLLGSVVVGLMSAVGPALFGHPSAFVLALAAAFALNLSIQLLAASKTAKRDPRAAPAIGIVAGNRNIALFLSVLPQTTADQLLLFIGCYQIPMYLTPVLLSGFYRRLSRL